MKLSIITVNKNNSFGLEKTCLSIVNQTYQDFEWIIIDGNSIDNSLEIIKKYSHKTVYWVSESDTGVYNAMNKGIRASKGDYLLFLNSGDFLLHPWTLQEVFNEIKISEYADVYFSDVIFSSYNICRFSENISLDYLLKVTINHQNCLIQRELFKYYLYDENYKIISDWHFLIKQIIDNNITFYHIKTLISVYDINGMSAKTVESSNLEKKLVLKELNIVIKEKISILSNLWTILKNTKYLLPYGIYKLLQSCINHIRIKKL
jgi:glycosyltransferase involved in cell wall biosynthesis